MTETRVSSSAAIAETTGVSPWKPMAYAWAALTAASIAYFVSRIPVQVTDSLGNMLEIQHETYWHLLVNQFYSQAYLRPLLWEQIKLAFDAAVGHYWLTFKTIHAAQLVVAALLFVRLLRIRRAEDFAAVSLATAVLIGVHTFGGLVREAFPINTFLTIVICVLAAVNLSMAPARWLNGVAAVLLFVFASLTIESGLLVMVAVVAGWLAGFRGISGRGVIALLVLTGIYFYLRFAVLSVGTPGMIERPSGFGFRIVESPELVARFGARPYVFYAYNVACSFVSLLLSEPRGGVWRGFRILSQGRVPPWLVINIVSSVGVSVVSGWFLWGALGRWRRGETEHTDRLAVVALAVIAGNAVMSFAYAKDAIMSVGGVLFAVLAYGGVRSLIDEAGTWRRSAQVVVSAMVLVLSGAWAVRAFTLPHVLREDAFRVRNEWATVDPWLRGQHIDVRSPDRRRLVEALREHALIMDVPHPNLVRPDYIDYLDLD